MEKKYALHPGWVSSRYDDDFHFIGIGKLARLYNLKPNEWISWARESDRAGRNPKDYIHLYPRPDGNYQRGKDEISRLQ